MLFVCLLIEIETSILPQHVHSAISSVEICITDVKYWMIENNFICIHSKYQALFFDFNGVIYTRSFCQYIRKTHCHVIFFFFIENVSIIRPMF